MCEWDVVLCLLILHRLQRHDTTQHTDSEEPLCIGLDGVHAFVSLTFTKEEAGPGLKGCVSMLKRTRGDTQMVTAPIGLCGRIRVKEHFIYIHMYLTSKANLAAISSASIGRNGLLDFNHYNIVSKYENICIIKNKALQL